MTYGYGWPLSSRSRVPSSGNFAATSATTSPTVAPFAWCTVWPPAALASTVGSLRVTDMSEFSSSGLMRGGHERRDLAEPGVDDGGRAEGGLDRLHRLEAVSRDAEDHLVGGAELPFAGELRGGGDGDAARGLGEDAGRAGEEADPIDQLVVRHRGGAAARGADRLRREPA